MTKTELDAGRMLYPETDHQRPKTRLECAEVQRPCPYVSCIHHLYLDVDDDRGAIKLNFPDLDVDQMVESCALDVADRGGATLEQVGALVNLTRERVRQVELDALGKLEKIATRAGLLEFVDVGPIGKRRLPIVIDEGPVDDLEDDG